MGADLWFKTGVGLGITTLIVLQALTLWTLTPDTYDNEWDADPDPWAGCERDDSEHDDETGWDPDEEEE